MAKSAIAYMKSASFGRLYLLLMVLVLAVAAPLFAVTVTPDQGVSISQVDFKFADVSFTDTRTGKIVIDVRKLIESTGITAGFVNMVTKDGWAVQNVVIPEGFPYPKLATYFDLGVEGAVTSIVAHVDYSPVLSTSAPGTPTSSFPVGDAVFSAAGKGPAYRATEPPKPPPVGALTFEGEVRGLPEPTPTCFLYDWDTLDITDLNVQAACSQCGPAAAANSLNWLHIQYGAEVPITDPHVLGLGADGSLVGALDEAMNRPFTNRRVGSGVWDEDYLRGMLSYVAGAHINNLVFKHMSLNEGPGNDPPMVDISESGLTSDLATGAFAFPRADWIEERLCDGEAVQLGYTGTGYGHWVTVLGIGIYYDWFIYHMSDLVQSDSDLPPDGDDDEGTDAVQFTYLDYRDDPVNPGGDTILILLNEPGIPYADILAAQAPWRMPELWYWGYRFWIDVPMCFGGNYGCIPIKGAAPCSRIGGFDFLIAYDASALTLIEVTPAELLQDCGWEYFTYRHGWQGNCEGSCPSGLVRIVAIADINNGPNHPSCYGPPDFLPHDLVNMKFYITNDQTYECMFVPIRFFWHDCGDNTVSNVMGDTLWISDQVFDHEGNEVTGNIHYGGHWWLGDCQNPDPDKPDAVPFLIFNHGGINIICTDSIDAPGDINLNDISNEIADAVLFTNYFIYGLAVFDINPQGQVAATDINNDGRVLTVGDLVYLIRIITGDVLPYPKLSPFEHSASVSTLVNHSAVAVSTDSETDIGAGYFVFEYSGYEIAEPHLINGASDMTLKYNNEDGFLKVLVYSMEKDIKIASGAENIFVIPISGEGAIELTETELSDYYGNLITVTKGERPILPRSFALHQNYPNPFNASTNIAFELPSDGHVKIEIFNIVGQRVVTLMDSDELAGVHSIEWNGLNESGGAVASGIYLYRLTSGDFSAEKKMVLMK